MEPIITKRLILEGRVQGVGFRYATRQIAMGFDAIGWVKNLADGSVELVLEGEQEEVDEFIQELTVESTLSHHIKQMREEILPSLVNIKGFSISK